MLNQALPGRHQSSVRYVFADVLCDASLLPRVRIFLGAHLVGGRVLGQEILLGSFIRGLTTVTSGPTNHLLGASLCRQRPSALLRRREVSNVNLCMLMLRWHSLRLLLLRLTCICDTLLVLRGSILVLNIYDIFERL